MVLYLLEVDWLPSSGSEDVEFCMITSDVPRAWLVLESFTASGTF